MKSFASATFLLVVSLAGCRFDPPGACAADAGCPPAQHCSEGVCAPDGRSGLGERCAVEGDCDSFADCVDHTCVLGAGACIAAEQCETWESCVVHACVATPGRCGGDVDCVPWEVCASTHVCALASGHCDGATDCADWQTCDATHTCVTAAGRCTADVECGAWQACASHTCDAAPGSCDDAGDCTAWESCGGDHVCALATGFCQGSADCAAWQSCGVLHQCVPKPGLCDSAGDCMGWETCTAHACVVAPGRCATGDDCAAFETCGAGHHCELPPGACGTQADCEGWQVCTSNVCETAPGRCAADPECAVPTYCLDHACGKPAFSPDEVLLLGSADNIEQSLSWGIVSRLSEPQHPVFGFPAGWNDQIALTSAGEVVYSYSERRGAWKMVPDSARLVGGLWQPPFAADANDVQVTTITCGTSGTYRWLVQSSTNTIVHTCNESTWYDAAGALRFTAPASRRLLAWNAADAKLLRGGGSGRVAQPLRRRLVARGERLRGGRGAALDRGARRRGDEGGIVSRGHRRRVRRGGPRARRFRGPLPVRPARRVPRRRREADRVSAHVDHRVRRERRHIRLRIHSAALVDAGVQLEARPGALSLAETTRSAERSARARSADVP